MRVKVLLLLGLCLTSFLSSASTTGSKVTINYTGQESDLVTLQRMISETRYRSEDYQGTCTRQIPYVVNECHDETRYREVCRYVAGHQDCETRYENECRYETRYREECSRGPSRRVCNQVPGRRVCHTGPSRQVCRDRNGQQVCRTVPGREVCRTGPSRQVCTNEPGRRTCRQVAYQDRVCRSVPRQHCEWIPGRNVCSQVPYSENVCADVTRYRAEDYSCTQTRQVPYQFAKKVNARVDVEFTNESARVLGLDLSFILNSEGQLGHKVEDNSNYFVAKNVNIDRHDSGDEVDITGTAKFVLFANSDVLDLVKTDVSVAEFNKNRLVFNVGRGHDLAKETIGLELVRLRSIMNDKTLINRVLAKNEYSLKQNENGTGVLIINLKQFDFEIKDKSHKIKLNIALDLDSSLNSEQTHFTKYAEFEKRP